MKAKTIKKIACILSAALVVTSVSYYGVHDEPTVVQAEETLFGIQKIKSNQLMSGGEYTILELVPDIAAAEAGYLVPNAEPIISAWDSATGEWTGWEKALSNYKEEEERFAYVEGLKNQLDMFLKTYGFMDAEGRTVGDVPVWYEQYKESPTYIDGYKSLPIASTTVRGYFEYKAEGDTAQGYDLTFLSEAEFDDMTSDQFVTGRYYYAVGTAITNDNFEDLEDDDVLYVTDEYGVNYVRQGTWGELKGTLLMAEGGEEAENPESDTTDEQEQYNGTVTDGDAAVVNVVSEEIEQFNTSVTAGDAVLSDEPAQYAAEGDDGSVSDGDVEYILNPDIQTHYLSHFRTITAEMARETEAGLQMNPKTKVHTIDMNSITPSENGEYKLVEDPNGYEYIFATESVYYTGGFVNGEWFREKILNMEPDEADTFRVKVVTMTYEQFNAKVVDDNSVLPTYDLLYLNSGMRGVNVTTGLDAQDLSAYAMKRLFQNLLDTEKACLLDASILYETTAAGTIQAREAYKAKNLYYMCALLSQDKPSSCYDDAGITKTVDEWLATVKVDADKNFVTESIYSFYGSLLNSGFLSNTIYSPEMEAVQEGFQDVLDEINTENLYRQSDSTGEYENRLLANNISQATAVRHVINYVYRRNAVVKDHIRVLELQPARVNRGTEDAEELNEDIVRSWIPNGENVKTVEITTMTTAEFIGKIENINEEYDLVYIGTETDYMNTDRWGHTVFNDTNMNGLIYYHTGDKRYVTMEMSGMLDTDYVNPNDKGNSNVYYYTATRYGGNDITEEKLRALDSFLDASYPVVVSDKFFESPATIYVDINYATTNGYAQLGVGDYNKTELKQYYDMDDNQLTSVRVSEGYEVKLYENDSDSRDSGFVLTYDDDVNWVGNQYNDKVSSVTVLRKENTELVRTVNKDFIDDSSYMYDFVAAALNEKKENFFSASDLAGGSEEFNFYLNRPKVDFANIKVNGSDYTKENNAEIYKIAANRSGKFTLEYEFTITNEGASSVNTMYACDLFIDVNADGKYSDSEIMGDITITWNGQEVEPNQLYADRAYKISRVLPDGYKGVLPWKIQISQNNNDYVHNSITGYTKLTGLPVETINILQICRPKITDTTNGWDGWWGGDKEVLFNLKNQVDTQGNVYRALIRGGEYNKVYYEGIGADYNINFEFVTTDEYERIYNQYYNNNPNSKDTTEFFKNYYEDGDPATDDSIDMLILGFSDAYDDISGAPLQGVVDFIGSGKSVLFAHDTVMYWNHSRFKTNGQNRRGVQNRNNVNNNGSNIITNQYYCSYDLTNAIRQLVGMDRYGVMTNADLRAGTGFGVGNTVAWNTLQQSTKDKAYTARSTKSSVVKEVQGFTYSLINEKYTGERQRTFTSSETGETGDFRNTYTNLKYGTVYYSNDSRQDNGEAPPNYNGEVTDLVVTKTNSGQITDYPYKLDDEFRVSKTHGQYYQLDFTADDDNDGQSDLVVWFCLGGRYKNADANQYQETIYSASPNDVANNYYIYNKGNVTYTGVGHAGDDENHTLDEAKLFVNTMIAAYKAGINDPSISCLSNGLPGSTEIKATYSFYDADNDISMAPGGDASSLYEKVYFKATDYNVVNGQRLINVNCFYPATGTGSTQISYGGDNISVKNITTIDLKQYYQDKGYSTAGISDAEFTRHQAIYDADTNAAVTNGSLSSGEIYYIMVPKVFIQDNMNADSMFNIYLEAQSTIIKANTLNPATGKPYQDTTSKVYTEFSFTRVNLFELE